MKILNLYAGIGGNRKHWNGHQITAIEANFAYAQRYRDHFPADDLICGDAHAYLLDHHKEYDLIWSSPPCQSHSCLNHFRYWHGEMRYPDMRLYEEIILLQHRCPGLWIIENVQPYYDPLIRPTWKAGRHVFWSNFMFGTASIKEPKFMKSKDELAAFEEMAGLSGRGLKDRRPAVRNMVDPEIGRLVLEAAEAKTKPRQTLLA